MTKTDIQVDDLIETALNSDDAELTLWNDDVNSFDHVVCCLQDICGFNFAQAEQCAMIAHMKGSYIIKKGDFTYLLTLQEAFTEKGITTTVEKTA